MQMLSEFSQKGCLKRVIATSHETSETVAKWPEATVFVAKCKAVKLELWQKFLLDGVLLDVKEGSWRPNVQTAGACPSFISIKHLGVLLLPPDRMLVHRRVMPQKYVTGTRLYTWVKRDSELKFLV